MHSWWLATKDRIFFYHNIIFIYAPPPFKAKAEIKGSELFSLVLCRHKTQKCIVVYILKPDQFGMQA